MGWRRRTTISPSRAARWPAASTRSAASFASRPPKRALKSLLLRRGARAAFTHSLYKLCGALAIEGPVERAAQRLDRYYVSARYPDALPGGAPFQVFQREDAAEALGMAETIIDAARGAS
ncbi:MAG: HEPN domain-containing protein [Proteobacteria bacterium]|nr:HEPN domain-containing protein [Pseudomonadota bacterium]